jgi:hypothetical protein
MALERIARLHSDILIIYITKVLCIAFWDDSEAIYTPMSGQCLHPGMCSFTRAGTTVGALRKLKPERRPFLGHFAYRDFTTVEGAGPVDSRSRNCVGSVSSENAPATFSEL